MSYDEKRARQQLEQILVANGVRSRALAKDLSAAVSRRAQASSKPPLAEILDQAFRDVGVSGRMRKIVAPAVVQSVAAGYGVLPSVGWSPSTALADKAASLKWEGADLPTLSDRIHGASKGYRQELEDTLRKSFQQAATVQQAARGIYDGYQPGFARTGPFAQVIHSPGAPRPELPQALKEAVDAASILAPEDKIRLKKYADRIRDYSGQLKQGPLRTSYLEMAKALESSGSKGLNRAIRVATEEKARYHADRIARTESARAWGAGFRDRIADDPRAVGIRSRTSSAHKIFDICDFHARTDMYGMGPGVYPKDRSPSFPYHPHCTCLLSVVYRRRPSEPPPRDGGPDMAAGARTLRGMTDAERRKLLTIPGARAFQVDPSRWAQDLRMWDAAAQKANLAAQQAAAQLRRGIELETMSLEERAVQEERMIWANAGFETGVIVRAKEESIRIVGQATSVRIPIDVIPQMKDALFTHNHPRGWAEPAGSMARAGNSFSVEDLRLGSFAQLATIRAVTPRYTYHLDYNGHFPTLTEVSQAHWDARMEVLSEKHQPGPGDYHHEVVSRVAERFGWTYFRRDHGFADGN